MMVTAVLMVAVPDPPATRSRSSSEPRPSRRRALRGAQRPELRRAENPHASRRGEDRDQVALILRAEENRLARSILGGCTRHFLSPFQHPLPLRRRCDGRPQRRILPQSITSSPDLPKGKDAGL